MLERNACKKLPCKTCLSDLDRPAWVIGKTSKTRSLYVVILDVKLLKNFRLLAERQIRECVDEIGGYLIEPRPIRPIPKSKLALRTWDSFSYTVEERWTGYSNTVEPGWSTCIQCEEEPADCRWLIIWASIDTKIQRHNRSFHKFSRRIGALSELQRPTIY